MFHQNAQHTGLSPYPGPTVPFLKWKFQTGGSVNSPPAVGHGRIYVGSDDGNLYALNLQGVLLWKFQTGNSRAGIPLIMTSPAIGSDGTIYLASYTGCSPYYCTGVLYAINPGGRMIWNLTVISDQGPELSSPTIGPDGTIYTSQLGYHILAVHPDGTLKWEVDAGGQVNESPTLGHDGTLYVGIDDAVPSSLCGKCLVALNPDGTLKWSLGDFSPFSVAVGADGTVYAAGWSNGGAAISPDGTVKWQFSSGGIDGIGPDGTIYVTGERGLNAVNPDGTLKWQFPTGNGALSSVAIGSNGVLYFGAGSSLYSVAPNGTLLWQFVIQPLSDPSIGSDGTIYAGSADGNVYAIG
jgi:outer membrane protein assembly factor BamB